jgi:hypothetical protein
VVWCFDVVAEVEAETTDQVARGSFHTTN